MNGDFIDGHVEMYFKEGNYKGEFAAGKYHGKGLLTLSYKEIYNGEFIDGFYNGEGHLQVY